MELSHFEEYFLYSCFPVTRRHVCWGSLLLIVNRYFTSISLHSGCCCGREDVETPIKQNVCVQVAQTKNPKAASSSQKSHPCASCEPVLRDIFNLVEQQGKQHSPTLLRCGTCAKQFQFSAKCYQYQEPVSYTHLTLPTSLAECRSRWSPYH